MSIESGAFPPVGNLTDACLLVADIPRSVAFYRDRLGLGVKRLDTGFAEFWTNGVILALWQRDDIADNLALPDVRSGGASCMMAVRLPSRGDLDREYERLIAAGVDFLAPPADYPWNAYCAYFRDPDGHLWELYCWPGAPRTLDTES